MKRIYHNIDQKQGSRVRLVQENTWKRRDDVSQKRLDRAYWASLLIITVSLWIMVLN